MQMIFIMLRYILEKHMGLGWQENICLLKMLENYIKLDITYPTSFPFLALLYDPNSSKFAMEMNRTKSTILCTYFYEI